MRFAKGDRLKKVGKNKGIVILLGGECYIFVEFKVLF